MKIKILLSGITILAFLAAARAQVTIGSDVPPRDGLLLDLKQDASINNIPNSTKGFGLPRVALNSLTTLTVDEPSKSQDYVGVTVYNTTSNSELSPGTYCWFNGKWNQVVLVNDAGENGNMLKSNGNNTYTWSTITVPEYKFWKPTQKAFFDQAKATAGKYTYNSEDIMPNNANEPTPGIFDNRFVYTDNLKINSAATSGKFLFLEITANVSKITKDGALSTNSYMEAIQIDVLIDGRTVKTYRRSYANPIRTMTNSIVDLFSVIPLDEFKFGKGEYPIQVKMSCTSHTYPRNGPKPPSTLPAGNFAASGPFLTFEAINFGFILYEEE